MNKKELIEEIIRVENRVFNENPTLEEVEVSKQCYADTHTVADLEKVLESYKYMVRHETLGH